MRWLRVLAAAFAAVVVLVLVAVVYLATLDLNAYKGEIQAAIQDAIGRPVEIEGPLRLAWSPTPSVDASKVRIANADWGSEPDMATIGSLLVHVGPGALLRGDIEVDRMSLSDVRLLLERGPDGQGNWAAAGGASRATDAGAPAIPLIELSDATVVWKPGSGTAEQVYRIDRLQLDGGGFAEPSRISLTGELRGEPLQLDGGVPALSVVLQPGTSSPLDVKGTLGGVPVALAGDMAVARGGDGGVERISLDKLRATYGGIETTGSAALQLGGAGPRLVADLAAEEIDIGRLVGDGGDEEGDPLDRDIPFDLLPAVDGEVDLAVARLVAGRWIVEELTATATQDGGKLTLDPVEGRVAGGAVWARGTVDTGKSPAALTLVATGDRLDMAQFYRALTDEGLIEGTGEATVDLEARGRTPRALLASVDGAVKLVVRDGVVLNAYWELIAADLATQFVPSKGDADRSRLNCLVGRFDIENGVADATVLMIDSERVLVGGEGTVRLADQRLDLRLVPQPKDPSLISLATPILLKGTLADPKVSPDPVEVAKGLGAIAAGAIIGPLAVLLPFVSGGTAGEACPAAIAAAEGRQSPGQSRQQAPTERSREQDKPGGIKGLFQDLRKVIE